LLGTFLKKSSVSIKHYLLLSAFFLFAAAYASAENPTIAVLEFTFPSEKILASDLENIKAMRVKVLDGVKKLDMFEVLPIVDTDKFISGNRIPIRSIYRPEYYSLFKDANISFVLSSDIEVTEKGYRLEYYLLSIRTGKFEKSGIILIKNTGPEINRTIGKSVREFFVKLNLSSEDLNGPIESALYAVGDIGPAGGVIFFVKPNNSGGWRYLEASPVDFDFAVAWGETATLPDARNALWTPNEPETGAGLGDGQRNTKLLIGAKSIDTANITAASACKLFRYNEMLDWFLPSRDELDALYRVVVSKKLGGFGDKSYWTSTQSTQSTAWFQTFNNGRMYPNGLKTDRLYIRPIRAF
jgi:hypothetical protein